MFFAEAGSEAGSLSAQHRRLCVPTPVQGALCVSNDLHGLSWNDVGEREPYKKQYFGAAFLYCESVNQGENDGDRLSIWL